MKTAVIAAALALLATPIGAATFDFAAIAHDAYVENGREVSFNDHFANGFTVDGVTVNATSNGAAVWLDSRSSGRSLSAGLGVCEIDDCNGHWLDGIDAHDSLTLTFDQPVRLDSMFVRESSFAYVAGEGLDHTPFTGTFWVDGESFTVIDGNTQGLDLRGSAFTFTADELFAPTGTGVSQYVSAITVAPIPVPAAGLLLIGALGGMAAWSRRRKA